MPSDHSPGHSRRNFLKTTASLTSGSLAAGQGPAPVPQQWALGELKATLTAQGTTVCVVPRIADAKPEEFRVALRAMDSQVAKNVFTAKKTTTPPEAESLALVQSEIEGRVALLVTGTDERGLVYSAKRYAIKPLRLIPGSLWLSLILTAPGAGTPFHFQIQFHSHSPINHDH